MHQSQLYSSDYKIIIRNEKLVQAAYNDSRTAEDNVKYRPNYIIWMCLWYVVTLIPLSHMTLPTRKLSTLSPSWVYPPDWVVTIMKALWDLTVYLLHTWLNPQCPPKILASSSRISSKINLPRVFFLYQDSSYGRLNGLHKQSCTQQLPSAVISANTNCTSSSTPFSIRSRDCSCLFYRQG